MADHSGNAGAARPDLDKAASGVLADDTVHAIELATQASESKVSTGRVRAGNDTDAEGDALKMHAASHGHAHKPPFKFHAILNTRPLRAQCIGCGALCCTVLLLVIAVVLGGTSVVNFTTDVPMYLRDHEAHVRGDAVAEAKKIANAEAVSSVPREREIPEFTLQIIYLAKDGRNILDPANGLLQRIQELETRVLSVPKYQDFCQLVYPNHTKISTTGVCARATSALYFFDPDYFKPAHTSYSPASPPLCPQDSSTPPRCTGSQAGWDMSNSQLFAQSIAADAAKLPAAVDIGAANVAATTSYWSNYHTKPFAFLLEALPGVFMQQQLGNMFYRVSDAGFGLQKDGSVGSTATALMTTLYFGLPLAGYHETDGDKYDEQASKVGEFLYDSYHAMLEEQTEWEDDFVILWKGSGMDAIYIETQLTTNMALVLGSVAFVLVYISIMTGSLYIGVMGLGQIFLAFPPSILLYRFVFGYSYFGTLNMMATFIILGIGADDIFVFLDTWDQMKVRMRGSTVQERMSATLRHAGKAMATTSFSTIFAFLANATSSFPAVYTFGVFCAMLVLCNFIIVCLYFPTVVAVRDRYFQHKRCCFCFCLCCRPRNSKAKKHDDVAAPSAAVPRKATHAKDAPPQLSTIPRWFRDWYYVKVVHPYRIPILVLYAILVIVMLAFAAQIRPDPDTPSLFPDGDNYLEVGDVLLAKFPREGNPRQLKAWIVFGIAGLDRTGTDPTVGTDRGEVKFDRQLDMSTVAAQEWILDLCSDIRNSRSAAARKVSAPNDIDPYPVMCFMESFRDYVLRTGGTFPVTDPKQFSVLARAWMASDVLPGQPGYRGAGAAVQYDVWKEYLYAEGVAESGALRMAIIEVATELELTTEFNTGIEVYQEWQDWMADMVLTAPDGLKTGFVVDQGGFHYFFLQQAILQEAVVGILLSILLAFCVLLLATGNYIMASLATGAILLMVLQVVGFSVMMGWKLGVLEAIVYVMVVGLAVDYVVHLADAYLESGKTTRGDRTQTMLALMGLSIVSGAVSTLGASFFLLNASIIFFSKFGIVIFFIIALAAVTSLVAFAALLDWKGPEGDQGSITLGATLARCFHRAHDSFWLWMEDDKPHLRRLEDQVALLSRQINQMQLSQAGDRMRRSMSAADDGDDDAHPAASTGPARV